MENRTIRRAASALALRDRSQPYEVHEATARTVLEVAEADLVLRELYDAAVAELQRARGLALDVT